MKTKKQIRDKIKELKKEYKDEKNNTELERRIDFDWAMALEWVLENEPNNFRKGSNERI